MKTALTGYLKSLAVGALLAIDVGMFLVGYTFFGVAMVTENIWPGLLGFGLMAFALGTALHTLRRYLK